MQVDLSVLSSILSGLISCVLLFVLVQLSLILLRVKKIVSRLETLSDIKSWISYFRRN